MINTVTFPGLGLEFTLNRVALTVLGRPIYWYGILVATGLALAFGDTSGGFRKLIQIVFGLSIAFAASSFFLSFFSFSGGAVV